MNEWMEKEKNEETVVGQKDSIPQMRRKQKGGGGGETASLREKQNKNKNQREKLWRIGKEMVYLDPYLFRL